MTYDLIQDAYNKFNILPNISYNVIKYLMDNDDLIWKLLKYNDNKAWDKPNLSKTQKGALIYDGSGNETNFRVFLDIGADHSWTIESCILRICPLTINPSNYVEGYIPVGCEVYSHYKINTLSNYTTRIETITQRLLQVLNGAEIDGLGRMFFDKNHPSCKSVIIGSIPYKGRGTIFCSQSLG